MRWLSWLLGHTPGRIGFCITTSDGRTATGRMSVNNINAKEDEIEELIRSAMTVEKGISITSLQITGKYAT